MWNHIKIIRFIKSIIPFRLRIILIRILFFVQYNYYKKTKPSIEIKEKNIYFLLSTDYSNLGDHAMSYASLKLLKDTFPEYNLIEITVNDTLKYLQTIKNSIRDSDIIVLKGGGNIGIQYFREELIRRKIIEIFKDTNIFIFPQTVYFPDTRLGRKEFNHTVSIYNSNPHLSTILRDEISYDLVKNKLNKTYLCPDIVFYLKDLFLNEAKSKTEKHCISLCMRDDVEGIYDNDFKERLKSTIAKTYHQPIQVFDTIKPYKIEITDRESELVNVWKQISDSKLVITDRLHAMIFCYLLRIPCIVLKTYNYKLIAQYEWIKNESFIELCEDNLMSNMIDKIDSLLSMESVSPVNDFSVYFERLTELLNNSTGES